MPLDGVRHFNTLYLEVARAIAASQAQFEDFAALKQLELNFLEHYSAAIRLGTDGMKCWRPLFESRMRRDIIPLQFALAGMNAHINHDLALALVQSWTALGIEPDDDGPFRRDYDCMNDLLAEVEERMRPRFIPDWFRDVAERMERLGDWLSSWNIRAAREAAWANGTILWSLREVEFIQELQRKNIDGLVGMAGRALLRPI